MLADPRRVAANELAVTRMFAAGAHLVDVVPARTALGLGPSDFLHAGPPIDWARASGPMRGALIGAALFEGLVTDLRGGRGRLARGTLGHAGFRAITTTRSGRWPVS